MIVLIEQAVAGFERYHKYAIGADLRKTIRGSAVQVIKAKRRNIMRIVTTIAALIFLGTGTVFAFTDNGDSTITDSRTSLVWQKQDDGTQRTWENAITYCEELTLAAQSDWRLPNIKELKTIVDNTKYWPAIDWTYFTNTQSDNYWSSSTFAHSTDNAWYARFFEGNVYYYYKTSSNYVRCVRGGQ